MNNVNNGKRIVSGYLHKYFTIPYGYQHRKIMEAASSWCNSYSDGLRNRSTRVRTPVAL